MFIKKQKIVKRKNSNKKYLTTKIELLNNKKGELIMRNFLNYIDYRTYYIYISFFLLSFATNLFYLDISEQMVGFAFLSLLLISIFLLLLIIPVIENKFLMYLVLLLSQFYIYTSTVLTSFNLVTLYLMLMSPILMFIFIDKRLFYLAISLNVIFLFIVTPYLFTYSNFIYIDAQLEKDAINKLIQVSLISQCSLFLLHFLMHKRLEKMQEFYEEIQYYDRLSTTSNITASVVHEIKNPLTIIKGYLQLFKMDNEIPEKKKETIDLLLREVEQIKGEINFLLNMSKPNENLKEEVISVQKELCHVINIMNSFLIANNVTTSLVSKQEGFVSMSSIEFKQLFINLIKNAVEASDPNKTIEIEVIVEEELVIIKVKDEGCGMTKSQLERIGTPYYTNKPLGNGLGMIVCTNIISKYNGKLSIMSELNQGTIVTVHFKRIIDTPLKIE